jgi:hypothetical protein
MAEPVAGLLRRSLEHLADEVPDSHRHLTAELGPLVVAIEVDGEAFSVRGGDPPDVIDGAITVSDVLIVTSRSAIVDVLDAAVSLSDAVESGRVRVQGTLDDIVRAHDALLAYAHAAVRAPSSPGLLAALRVPGRCVP